VNNKHWRLKIIYDDKEKEIVILGDKKGFEFLIERIKDVIKKGESKDGHQHYHLQWQMNNLDGGSTGTVLVFTEDPEDYE
jgi:hypothetical protein